MCGGSSTTTQSVSIPPEVLARYNAVNARAEQVAEEPFKRYEGQFVAPLTDTQRLGIKNTYNASQQAQPYYQLGVAAQNDAYSSGLAGTQAAYAPLYAGYNQSANQMGGAEAAYFGANVRGADANQRAAQTYAQANRKAQPYFSGATQDLSKGLGAASIQNASATSAIRNAPGSARSLQDRAGNLILSSVGLGQGYYDRADSGIDDALAAAKGANKQAFSSADAAPGAAKPIQDFAQKQIMSAEGKAEEANREAMRYASEAKDEADPYQRDATQGVYDARDLGDSYLGSATLATAQGGEDVNQRDLDIQRYLNPYTREVADSTYRALRQQQEQEMAGQTGNAIRSGAFGGDRAGLVAANLARQQTLGTAQAMSPIYERGYQQALGTAQQQQGVDLSARQANRAAQQQMAQQLAMLGQQGYGQRMGAAQQLEALGQGAFNRGIQSAQTLSGLGQTEFGQSLSSGQAGGQLGSMLYDQGNRQAQLYSQLGNTAFQQNLSAAAQRQSLGQAAANTSLMAGQAAGQLGSQLFGQNLQQGQAFSQLGQNEYQQRLAASQQRQAIGQGQANLGMQYGQAQQGLGQQSFAQGLQYGQAQQGMGQQYFNQGQGMAQQLAGLGLQNYNMGSDTAKNYAALGAGSQQAALQGAQALIGAGTLQQQTQQAEATANYQQFLQERGYPFQVAQFLANIAMGTGALSGSTTTTTQPSSFFGNISDARAKEDITPVGETFDGQTIYRFRYKGEKAHQIGLIAQEVEQAHPEAVGRSQGFKTVDYDRATKDAAKIGLGAAQMDRPHRAPGGLVPADDLRAILAMQQQSFGPFAQAGLYGGTPQDGPMGAAGSYVPKAGLPVGKLMTAGAAPRAPESGISQLKGIVGAGEKLFGKEGLLGKGGLGEKVVSKVSGLAGAEAAKPSAGGLAPATSGAAPAAAGVAAGAPAPTEEKGLLERLRDGAADVLDTTSKALGRNAGGRTGYAGLGKVINPMELQDPSKGINAYIEDATEGQDEAGALPKPGALPAEKSSGLSDALGLATKAAGLISAAPAAASAAGSGISALMALLPIVSDARLKDNIRPVGKTYDGQNIYAYDFGDGRTQMGLIAQEVARHKPDAVGRSGDYLTVDYNRATEDAAPGLAPRERASGGLVPRFGYASGGEPYDMNAEHPADAYFEKYVIPRESGGKQFDAEGRPLTSSAGAIGVAQVMPKTAPEAARYAGVEFDENRYRTDPDYNKTLGKAYFRRMYDDFAGGDPVRAMAAYNAGPGGLQRAVAKAGEGGDWRAHLPSETRNYIAGVGDRPAQNAQPVASGLAPPPAAKERNFLHSILPTSTDAKGEESINWKKTLIPILSGLGGMASSPSRYLGAAILQGLGTGADAYANLEKKEQDIAESKARERADLVTAEVSLSGIPTTALISDPKTGIITGVRVYGPGNRIDVIKIDEYNRNRKAYRLAPEVPGGLAPSGPEVPPSLAPPAPPPVAGASTPDAQTAPQPGLGGADLGKPSDGGLKPPEKPQPIYVALPRDLEDKAKAAAERVGSMGFGTIKNDPAQAKVANPFTDQDQIASEARSKVQTRNDFARAMTEIPESGFVSSNIFSSKVATPVVEAVNGFLRTLNLPDDVRIARPEDLKNVETVKKIAAQLGFANTSEAGQRSNASLERWLSAIPSQANTPQGAAGLVAELYLMQQREIDLDNFYRTFRRSAEKHTQTPAEAMYVGEGLSDEFSKRMDKQYADEKKALSDIFLERIPMKNKNTGKVEQVPLMSVLAQTAGKPPQGVADYVRGKYGDNVLRYFGGQ